MCLIVTNLNLYGVGNIHFGNGKLIAVDSQIL